MFLFFVLFGMGLKRTHETGEAIASPAHLIKEVLQGYRYKIRVSLQDHF